MTFTLTGGTYGDPSFVGMKGILTRSVAYIDPSTGVVSQTRWTVTIASDETWAQAGLPYNDDGSTYSMDWQALSWKPTPDNRTFQVLSGSGATTVDFDGLPLPSVLTSSPLAGVPFVTAVNGHTGVVSTGDLGIGASFVIHGAMAGVARPTTTLPVVWFGSVSPTNADSALDVWIPTSSDGGASALASLQAALAAKADLTAGVVPDGQLPTRLSDVSLKAAYVALGQLAASPDLMAVGTITRSATGAATGFGVVWPDGATGTFAGTESTTAPGALDSYTVTHVAGGVTITYTQPALTRDSTGAVTTRPAMTVA